MLKEVKYIAYDSELVNRRDKMQNIQIKALLAIVLTLIASLNAFIVVADEIIIQQEKISFEKCLEVIMTSENKLSIAPEITDVSNQKRVAVFTLSDGTLTITCDGDEGNVTVSTNSN